MTDRELRLKLKAKERYLKNRDNILKNRKEKYANDPAYKEEKRAANYKYVSGNPEYRLHKNAKQRAFERNLEFSITKEDIKIPTHCPYLGVELFTGITPMGEDGANSVSLDRIDSSKGYTPDNIQVISLLANKMKSSANMDQLIAFSRGILKMHTTTD